MLIDDDDDDDDWSKQVTGPLDHTTTDFWRMAWEEESTVIVMLNRIIEKGRLKCHPYYPTGLPDSEGGVDNEFRSYDDSFTVRFISRVDHKFYVSSQLELVNNEISKSRTITHLHYYAWPDFGVPESPSKFLTFLNVVREVSELSEGPPVVHCSAGIGRTGTLVLIDTILDIMRDRKTEHIDVYSILLKIRFDRFGLVQTHEQLRFVFLSILEGMQDIDTSSFTKDIIVAEIDIENRMGESSSEDDYEDTEDEDDEDEGEHMLIDGVPIEHVTTGMSEEEEEDDDVGEPVIRPESIELIESPDVGGVSEDEDVTPELLVPSSISPISGLSEEELEEVTAQSTSECNTACDVVEGDGKEEARRERKDKMASMVDDMKKKLVAHEESQERRHDLWVNFGKPLVFGSIAAVGLSILIYLVKYLNRYQDVLPFDSSRVCLQSGRRNYINASYVRPPFVEQKYICCQGPLDHTTTDFWRMAWEEESTVIVMLNRIIEKGRLKCHPYYPTGLPDSEGGVDNEFRSYDDSFTVRFISRVDHKFYVSSQLELVNNEISKSRTITHLHYYAWPDFGVPESPSKFLTFLNVVREVSELSEGPPVVHCSAGIGRTGTLVLIDTILDIMRDRKTEHIDVYSILLKIRFDRFGLVQTHEQLRFVFLSILEGMQDIDTSSFTKDIIVAEIDIENRMGESSSEDDYEDTEDEDDEDEGEHMLIDGVPIEHVTTGMSEEEEEDDDVGEPVIRPESIELIESPDVGGVSEDEDVTPELLVPSSISPISGLSEEELEEVTAQSTSECDVVEGDGKEEARRERKDKMASMVDDMKKKLVAHEESQERRHDLWVNFGKPLVFGSIAAVGLSILIYLVKVAPKTVSVISPCCANNSVLLTELEARKFKVLFNCQTHDVLFYPGSPLMDVLVEDLLNRSTEALRAPHDLLSRSSEAIWAHQEAGTARLKELTDYYSQHASETLWAHYEAGDARLREFLSTSYYAQAYTEVPILTLECKNLTLHFRYAGICFGASLQETERVSREAETHSHLQAENCNSSLSNLRVSSLLRVWFTHRVSFYFCEEGSVHQSSSIQSYSDRTLVR
eukprot:sb/3461430/